MTKRAVQGVLRQFDRSGKDLQSEQATRWLAKNLSNIQTQMNPQHFIKSNPKANKQPSALMEGSMLFFGYDPRTKNTLPFWDAFPLVILLHKRGNNVLGLNLHYLSPSVRANFLNNLLKFVTNPDYVHNPPSRFKATYNYLKAATKLKPFRSALKMYYLSNIVSKVNLIPSDEWQITTFMPLEKFKGASREDVWKWSAKYSK